MDWDAGALVVRDFLHDAPEAYLTHTAAADGATPATLLPNMPGFKDQPADGAHLRWVHHSQLMAEETVIILRCCEPEIRQLLGQLTMSMHVRSPRASKRAREDEDGLERYLRDLGHRGGAPRFGTFCWNPRAPGSWHALQASYVWLVQCCRRH